ncbi:MAG: PA14 domain-containing protein [Kiritimatiellaeota bacterium]|nr:PA14 domain-containing protein [Kiritimatiellota bacterium]
MSRWFVAALVALAVGVAAVAAPNVLINLDAGDFVSVLNDGDVVPAWANNGTLGGDFMPVATGAGTTFSAGIDGVPAVSFARGVDSVMTNWVSPNVICGAKPWAFEVWVYKTATYNGSEDVFTWTAREAWPLTGNEGSCVEFRYGSDVANAVERYGSGNNLRWNGLNGSHTIPALGQWHHVAATRGTDGIERLYLDGEMRDARTPKAVVRDDVGFFTLAATPRKDNGSWDMTFGGAIARLRIYDGPLSFSEVIANYTAEYLEFFGTTPPVSIGNDRYWDGPVGSWAPWGPAGNWFMGLTPVDGNNIYIDNGGKAAGLSGTNVFSQFFGYNGALEMTDGLLMVTNPAVSLRIFDFDLKGGTFHLTGNANRHLYIGQDNGPGRVTVGGTSEPAWLRADEAIQVGKGAAGIGYLEVLANGLVTTSNNNFFVTAEGATGEVVVNGGTIRCERNRLTAGHGGGAQSKIRLNSGLVEMPGELYMSDSANASNVSEIFMNGGLLWLQRFSMNTTGTGTNIVYLNGGTIRNRDTRGDFMQSLTAAYVQSGGAVFDIIAGTTIDINQPLLEYPSDVGGGLVKLGGGTLALRGVNTFTGDITVSDGTLLLRNANALPGGYSGNILLENGGGIGWDVAGGATALLALLDTDSVGTLYLFGASMGESIDLSNHPGVALGMYSTGGTEYTGTFTPPISNVYRFTVASGENRFRPQITGTASVIIEAASAPTGEMRFYGDNNYTGGTTINGGRFGVYHANALGTYQSGVKDIRINNGAGLLIDVNIGQQGVDQIISRIHPDSRGAILIRDAVRNYDYDFTGLPGISLGSDNGRDFFGTLTPDPSVGYHVGGGGQGATTGGIRIRDFTGAFPVVVDYPGTAELTTNNTFTGGIIVTNGAGIFIRDGTSLGADPLAPVADWLFFDNGLLRPSPQVFPAVTGPNHGMTVGDGGLTIYPEGDRFFAWRGDLHGTGAITNNDNGIIIFGGANNTWTGTLSLNNNNDNGTFAVGFGNEFSWVKTNVIQGTANGGMFGVATDLDITWSDKFEHPLGNVPVQYNAPDGVASRVGLRKLGTGTLTLNVPNTYTRETQVEHGILKMGTANAIPWGGGKSSLNVKGGLFYPGGTLDLNGFDTSVNGLKGAGTIIDASGAGKTLTVGNANANETYYGISLPPAKIAKTGGGAQTFMKGADISDLIVNQGAVQAGAETSFGSVTLAAANTAFNLGRISTITETNGLTGEYYWFNYLTMTTLVNPAILIDLDVFNNFLEPYAPYWVESSVTFGEGFDPGDTGQRFQNGFNNRAWHYSRWTGEFYAEADGDYIFTTMSDDGSAIYIDRQPAVTNSFLQGYEGSKRSGEPMHLAQGWHDIVIGYYQGDGGRGMTVFFTPPDGEETILPQRLLRPYPVTVGALAGVAGSRVTIPGNMALRAAVDTVSVFSGSLAVDSPDARLIKEGTGDLILAGQATPEFFGQLVINDGRLGLQGANPFPAPVTVPASDGALAVFAERTDIPSRGLKGTYYAGYDGNFNPLTITGGTATTGVIAHFQNLQPLYAAYTVQTGLLAVADAPTLWYDNGLYFPGPYSREYGDGKDKEQLRVWFTGRFLALEPGEYIFGMQSDDRANMFIDGVRVVAETTSGQPIKSSEPIYLEAGTHDMQIAYGQAGGQLWLRAFLTVPGDLQRNMPNELLRPIVSQVYGVNGDGELTLPDDGSFLRLEIETAQTFDGEINGAPGAEIEKNGTEAFTLAGDNDAFGGTWYVMKGTLIAGDGATSGTLGGRRVHVAAGARLVFNRADDIVYDGEVTGGGEICSIGGGRVTFSNFGSGFTGILTQGDIVIGGEGSVLSPANFPPAAEGLDLRVWLTDGVTFNVPPGSDPNMALAPLVLSDVTVTLPHTSTDFYIESLAIEAGKTAHFGVNSASGLFGRYYDIEGFVQNDINAAFKTLSGGEAYLENFPPLGKFSSWEAGDNLDFAENGSGFPEVARTHTVPGVTEVGVYFGAIWKGKINITEPGEYSFITRSDDGTTLFINGNLLIDNVGSHAMGNVTNEVVLAAGTHDFALLYQQGGGGYGLRVYVKAPGASDYEFLPNAMLIADPLDMVGVDVSGLPTGAALSGMAFTLEVGTLGVINGPGTGTLDVTGLPGTPQSGTLKLNNLHIESPGAVIAAVGDTVVAGATLHVEMGAEPPLNARTLIGDFTQTLHGLPLANISMTLDGAPKASLDYRNSNLYVVTPGGTVLILR